MESKCKRNTISIRGTSTRCESSSTINSGYFTNSTINNVNRIVTKLCCNYIVSHTSIVGPKSSVQITDHIVCTDSNVIYCIKCSRCNLLYVGETGRRLGDRIREHIYDIRKGDLTKPVSRHFNSANHSLNDFVVFGLSLFSGNNDCRKTKEMRLIHLLGTHAPNGLNERFAFN